MALECVLRGEPFPLATVASLNIVSSLAECSTPLPLVLQLDEL
jgi:hypothetical protein